MSHGAWCRQALKIKYWLPKYVFAFGRQQSYRCYKCDTHDQCHTVTQCDTNPKKFKSEKNT
jgi:NADPH-dependent glutamate synthase beta subunit-like oxidoreductase